MKQHLLPHHDIRPADTSIDTLVIHSMYAKGKSSPLAPRQCIATLDEYKVSAHYLISQSGEVWQLVPETERAWHAGVSQMPDLNDSRFGVNDFSIGIELIADETSGISKAQYKTLAELTAQIISRYPVRRILGHEHIAPERKVDPGSKFNWDYFRELVLSKFPGAQSAVFGPPV